MAWVVLGQSLAALGGLVGVRVLTEVLPPERYGELALGITLATLGQLVAWSPISAAVLRYFAPAQESLQLTAYLLAVRRLLVQATVALAGLGAIIVVAMLALGSARWVGLALAALLFTALSGYESALDSMQLAGRQRRIVAFHQGAATWLRFLLAVALISLSVPSSAIAMVGFCVGVLLVLGSQLFFFRRRVLALAEAHRPTSAGDSTALARRMTQYAWPVAAWGVFSWTQAVSDRWILQAFTTTAVVGVYSVVNQVGFYPMTLFSAVTLQFVSPVLFARAGDGSDPQRLDDASQLVQSVVAVTLAVTVVATVISLFSHRAIFSVLVGVRYRAVSPLLPWMVCAGGFFAAGQAASQVMLVAGSTKRLIAPKGAIAAITLGLYAVGARLRGLDGVVYANATFGVLYFAWMAHLARRWRTVVLRTLDSTTGESVR
jgi:O-antigen/teichoic acid export membrane protein